MSDPDPNTARPSDDSTWDAPSPTRESLDHNEQVALAGVRSRLLGVQADPVAIGRYIVAGRIGAGGMGTVYEAHDPELARTVAIKVLRRRLGSDATVAARRLRREAQALARVSHPNVVKILDVGTHAGAVFIAMERISGESLDVWVARGQTVDAVLRAFTEAADGLAAAHAQGLVHRDFKPSNVLMGDDGRSRVLDFGLARPSRGSLESTSEERQPPELAAMPSDAPLTDTGALLGTPAYMAPEQWHGRADERSDQFSLCFALFEALTGKRPNYHEPN